MNAIFNRPWGTGLIILFLSTLLGMFITSFGEFIFSEILWIIIWILPGFASYISSRYSKTYKLLKGFSYIILSPLIITIVHYITRKIWNGDFPEISGAIIVFKISFVTGGIPIAFGTIYGLLFSSKGQKGGNK